jgi:hypothetical protein
MGWNYKGNLKGPSGSDSALTTDQLRTLFGFEQYKQPPHGSLVWSGPWFNPPGNAFLRLRKFNNGRLVKGTESTTSGKVVYDSDDNPCLVAPVDGLYLVSATQCWGTDVGAKGCGLGTSTTSGLDGMVVWADTSTRFASVSKVVFLRANTRLYPWTFSMPDAGMSPADRGIQSEYSITFLQAI